MDFVEYIRNNTKNNVLNIKVISGARETKFQEILDDGTLKIKVAAHRENGKANKELLGFLKKNLRLSKDSLSIISGETSEYKKINIQF